MSSTKSTARLAGVLYLLLAITGFFSLMYATRTFVVPGDAAATARRILEAEPLYRLGILSELASLIVFVLLAWVLYRLFQDVDRNLALLLVILVSVSSAIGVANVINFMAPLTLLGGADFLSGFTQPQLEALTLGFLRLRGYGHQLNEAFWGLWLFPFGVLVIRSRFIPAILGILLVVAGFAYLAASFVAILLPAHADLIAWLPLVLGSLGEGAMILWLLIRGAKVPQPEAGG